MKKPLLYPLSILILISLLFITCEKDEPAPSEPEKTPNTDYMVYDNGSGEIGKAGGEVTITESSSPLNGVTVTIPEGALDKNVNIEVEASTNPYQDDRTFVNFKPDGLEFEKPVQITLPYDDHLNKDSITVYYWDEDNNQTIEIGNEAVTNNFVTASTAHFSNYSADEKCIYADLGTSNGILAAGGHLTFFSKIPLILMSPERSWPNIVNAEQLIQNNPFGGGLTVRITYELGQKKWPGIYYRLAETEILIRLTELYSTQCSNSMFVYKTNGIIDDLIYSEDDVELLGHLCIPSMDDFYYLLANGTIFRGIFDETTFVNTGESLDGKNLVASIGFSVGDWELSSTGKFLKHTETLWGISETYELDEITTVFIGDDNQNGIPDDFESINKPEIEITSPENNSTYSVYDEIEFQCNAIDEEDGTLADTQIQWSFQDGNETNYFDNGTTLILDAGSYEFTVTATDSDGNTTETNINITVTPDNNPPTATITVPAGISGGDIQIEYTISDADGNANDLFVTLSGVDNPSLKDFSAGEFDGGYINGVEPGTHTFVWDSEADLPERSGSITISMGYLNSGSRARISDYYEFEIDNTGNTSGEIEYGELVDTRGGETKTYRTVIINGKEWMAENLAYDVVDGCWAYNNNESNVETYGRLYTWDAALAACPEGWHVPTDDEWKQLEMFLGMSQSEADDTGYRGTDEGTKLKATSGWNNNGNGTDDYGFSALPGGYRTSHGNIYNIGDLGSWWSATEGDTYNAWYRTLTYTFSDVRRYCNYKDYGFSVRCVRD
ncbi:hypothetical protein GM418_09345 [Maribellus comscasis]|uniref:PKD domain-containing protein n=1 Tax=Maribellus comscasis TaxID=2681766 RepID=A0A6I6JXJ5_9BACT|nr:FISUMP domain-containing protein [Maribellus comscasis]QGY43853.1 hypothetical protein GM418_09345 [Maribellus comscasis]